VASTPERKVKEKVVTVLKQHGAYYFFPATYGLGRAGIPDIIACHHGCFVAIECKAGMGKTTALQIRELDRIRKAGGIPLIINETNIDLVHDFLEKIEERENEIDRQVTKASTST
jgi:Holliday junction resolvase